MKKYWTMRDGTKAEISKMESSHILNCMKMLERNATKMKLYAELDMLSYTPSGDGASYAFDCEIDSLSSMDNISFLRLHTAYESLEKELNKRNYKI